MKLKITSIALTGLLLLTSACASNVTTNTTSGANQSAPATDTTDTTATNAFPVKTRTADEVNQLLSNGNDRIFFDTNSAYIDSEAKEIVERIAPVLANTTNSRFIIEGHADERGTRAYNLALGKKRANALKRSLVSHNVNSQDITTITYGKDRPANPGHDAQAWSENRRAVVVAKNK